MATRNSKGQFVKRSGGAATTVVVASPRAPRRDRRAPAAAAAPRRRRTSRKKDTTVRDLAIVAGAGYLLGRWLSGDAGKKAVADAKLAKPEGPLQYGLGLPILAAGVAAMEFGPREYGDAAALVAAGGALLVGLRFASDDRVASPTVITAGPDLHGLASLDVSGGDDDEETY